ncbi:MAG: PLP-dependent transferase [Ruthenibacterium lactatiformans]
MHIETKCLHEGYKPGNGEPKALPIYQSTTYTYDSTEHIGQLFDLSADGHMYSRISNPTVAAVEQKSRRWRAAWARCHHQRTGGQSACGSEHLHRGDHFVAASTIYGGTVNLFAVTLKKFGIEYLRGRGRAGGGDRKGVPPQHKGVVRRPLPTLPSLCWTCAPARTAHRNGGRFL